MDNDEIKRRILDRIDADEDFGKQIGGALEVGAWEIVAQLISRAVGYVIERAGEFWEWLKRQF
jgi:hypothetical protein